MFLDGGKEICLKAVEHVRLWPRAARPLPRGKVYSSQHSADSASTVSGPWFARPREDKGLAPPQRSAVQKNHLLLIWEEFSHWKHSKQIVRKEVEKNGVKTGVNGGETPSSGTWTELKVAALIPWTLLALALMNITSVIHVSGRRYVRMDKQMIVLCYLLAADAPPRRDQMVCS